MAFSDTEKLNASNKLSLQLRGTSNADPGIKEWYSELFPWQPTVTPDTIWNDFASIPGAANPTEADANVGANPSIMEKRVVRLTAEPTSNYRAYLARTTFGDNTAGVYKNGIPPALVQYNGGPSNGYVARLYHGDPDSGGVEIMTTQHGSGAAPAWSVFYPLISVAISTDQSATFRTYYDTDGLWLVVYRYIGPTGGGSGGPTAVPFTDQFQVDVSHGLGYRPVVQVLEKAEGGIFGSDEGFGVSFGSSDIYREIEPVHVEIHHLSTGAFRVLLDNYYTGEVLYF